MVGVRGFEPPAPASRRQCSTRLSYTPSGPARFIALTLPKSKNSQRAFVKNYSVRYLDGRLEKTHWVRKIGPLSYFCYMTVGVALVR